MYPSKQINPYLNGHPISKIMDYTSYATSIQLGDFH
jgi:hypothetical protein